MSNKKINTVIAPIVKETINDERNELFNLMIYELEALNEKSEELSGNDPELFDNKMRRIFVKACIKNVTFEPRYNIQKSGMDKLMQGKLTLLKKLISQEKNLYKKAALNRQKIILAEQVKQQQMSINGNSIAKHLLKNKHETLEALEIELCDKSVSELEKAKLEKVRYDIKEYIDATDGVLLSKNETINRLKQLVAIEKNILNKVVKIETNNLIDIELLDRKLEIFNQRANIEQIQSEVDYLKTRDRKIKTEKISHQQATQIMMVNAETLLKDYLEILEEKLSYYKESTFSSAVEIFNQKRSIYFLELDIKAKKDFLYHYINRTAITP